MEQLHRGQDLWSDGEGDGHSFSLPRAAERVEQFVPAQTWLRNAEIRFQQGHREGRAYGFRGFRDIRATESRGLVESADPEPL
jgi:hypothetical protein